MLINRYYSIPKWKKIVFAILFSLLVFSTISVHVYSWSPLDWISAGMKDVTDNISDEFFTSVDQSASEAFGSLMDWVLNVVVSPFTPTADSFIENTGFEKVNATDFLKGFAVSVGMFVSTLIWGFSLCLYFFKGSITDTKDTPISLTARYVVAIIISYKADAICTTFNDLIDILYTSFTSTAITTAIEGHSKTFLNVAGGTPGASGESTSMTLLGTTLTFATFPGVALIMLIIEIFLVFTILKEFIKFYMEMISRYITSYVFLFLFPAFGGTIVSNNTNDIFKSYMKTLMSSFILLLFNIMWFKMCFLIAFSAAADPMDLIKYVFLLELLHFGQKFDGMLRSMGLGVATGGSRIGQAIGGAARNLANGFRGLDRARKTGGNLLTAGGALAGNKGLFDAGNMLSGGNTGKAIDAAMNGRKNPGLAPNADGVGAFAAKCGSMGNTVPDNLVSKNAAAEMVGAALGQPDNNAAQDALRGLSDNKLKEGAQALCGSGVTLDSVSAGSCKDANGNRGTALTVTGTRADGSKFKGTIGSQGLLKAGEQLPNAASGIMMRSENALRNGQSCSRAQMSAMAGHDANAACNSMKGRAQTSGQTYTKLGQSKDVGNSSNPRIAAEIGRVTDAGGNIVGSTNGSHFTAAASLEANQGYLDGISDRIHDAGYSSGNNQWESVTGKEGSYSLNCEDSEGNNVTFTATDKGMQPFSTNNGGAESFTYEDSDEDGNDVAYDVNESAGRPSEERNTTENVNYNDDSDEVRDDYEPDSDDGNQEEIETDNYDYDSEQVDEQDVHDLFEDAEEERVNDNARGSGNHSDDSSEEDDS